MKTFATKVNTPASSLPPQNKPQLGNWFGSSLADKGTSLLDPARPPLVQTKLTVNEPGDRYEQEADRVADEIMRMPASTSAFVPSGEPPPIQKKCAACASGKGLCPQCAEEEKNLLQRKETAPAAPQPSAAFGNRLNSLTNAGGKPLAASERGFFEPRFGRDFSTVRIHDDGRAAGLADEISARAFTYGQNVFFGNGQYQPQSPAGRHLLAHELVHTLQQGEGPSPLIQRTPAECETLLSTPPAASLIAGTAVHNLIQADFMGRAQGAVSVMIPGASATALRSQGICGADSSVINPQVIGGRAGGGFPDLSRITPGGILQVAEIKPAAFPCLVDGEEQLLRYVDQGNAADPAQVAWRNSLGIRVVVPMPESAYTPPTLTSGNLRIRTAWCNPGLMIYAVEQQVPVEEPVPHRVPVQVPERTRERAFERIRRFIEEVVESGQNAEEAAREFLQENPWIAPVLIGAAVAIVVGTIVEDVLTAGVGIADDPASFAAAFALVRVAQSIH